MALRGQGQGFGQAKEICTGSKLRAPVFSPEHVSPHLHASGQLLSVDMPAQDLVSHCKWRTSVTDTEDPSHLASPDGSHNLPHPAPEGDQALLLTGQGLPRPGF